MKQTDSEKLRSNRLYRTEKERDRLKEKYTNLLKQFKLLDKLALKFAEQSDNDNKEINKLKEDLTNAETMLEDCHQTS